MGQPYAAQLASAQERCAGALAGVAPEVSWLAPFAGVESGFRNKAKLVVAGETGAVTLGILDAAGRGVDLRTCGLYEPGLAESFSVLADFVDELRLEPYDVPGRRGELKHLIVTHAPDGGLMVRFVLRSRRHLDLVRKHLPRLRTALPRLVVASVNLLPEHKAVLEGDTEILLTEAESLPMQVNDVVLHLRPNSFFQTNTEVAAALYRQARRWVSRSEARSVLDLYCGVGGFALHVVGADGQGPSSVVGVEVAGEAVASARLSASELRAVRPGLGRVEFHVGDATQLDLSPAPDVVIVNPPRRGIGPDLCRWLEASPVREIVYSSCNVDSLAKDLAALPSFRATEARVFDMFPQTTHLEVMVRLASRRHGTAHGITP